MRRGFAHRLLAGESDVEPVAERQPLAQFELEASDFVGGLSLRSARVLFATTHHRDRHTAAPRIRLEKVQLVLIEGGLAFDLRRGGRIGSRPIGSRLDRLPQDGGTPPADGPLRIEPRPQSPPYRPLWRAFALLAEMIVVTVSRRMQAITKRGPATRP